MLSKLAGGIRVNQTSVPGGLKEVQLINESGGRREIDNLLSCYIKSADGDMVQIRQFADVELISAPPSIDHYRFHRSVKFNVQAAPGFTQGQAIQCLKEIFAENNFKDLDYGFVRLARTQNESGGQVLILFALAGLAVFLIPSETYESYITLTTILLTVPLAILGGLLFVKLRSMNINVFP